MIGVVRRRVMGGGGEPQMREIEYLESRGAQYILTGYVPNSNTYCMCEFMTVQPNSNLSYAVVPYGGRVGWNNKHFAVFSPVNNVSTNIICVNNQGFQLSSNLVGQKVKTIIDSANHSISIDGNTFTFYPSVTYTIPISLFCLNANGTIDNSANATTRILRLYNFQIKENDVSIIDMIPVRLGTTGYMYDRVSGQLFGNSGTGSFTLGSDV